MSPLALWTLAPLTSLAGGSLARIMGPVNSTCWLHYLECEAIINNLNCSMGLNGSKGI